MLKQILHFFFSESWLNHRIVAAIGLGLSIWVLYYGEYIEPPSQPSKYPFPFLVLSAFAAFSMPVYLIEHHDEKWQLFMGYIGLCVWFLISLTLTIDPNLNWLRQNL